MLLGWQLCNFKNGKEWLQSTFDGLEPLFAINRLSDFAAGVLSLNTP